jgi:hypothetical protein
MRASHLSLLISFGAAFVLGCGGAVFTQGESPGGDDGGTADSGAHDSGPGPSDSGPAPDSPVPIDSGPGPWSLVCPGTTPAIGAACNTETVQCEYGDSWWNISCDTVVQCVNTQWTSYKPSFSPCTPAPGPNPSSCPTDYASVSQGSACSTNGLSCYYPQGVCACQVPLGGPVQLDGGTGYWGCVPEPGCPWPRPRLGSTCHLEGTSCTYEACAYAQQCINGMWQAQLEACAGAATGG